MKRMTILAAIALLTLCRPACAEPPAGIALYFESGGEVYILLAEHRGSQRGWAAFGGGARDGESLAETAAHKSHEESRGYFSQEELLRKIEGQEPVMDGEFAAYFAEVDFVPAQRIQNNPVPKDDDSYGERGTFAWIPYSIVKPHLEKEIAWKGTYPIDPLYLPKGSETTWFWPAFLSNLKKAIEADALPWKP